MSINNVLLFVSSTSQSSISPIKFIREHNLPVLIVRLDTIEDRIKAANGQYFKITEVPTLVVFYVDDTLQLFVGSDKIMTWMNAIVKSKEQHEVAESTVISDEIEIDEVQEKPKKGKKGKKKKNVTFDENIDLLETPPSKSKKTVLGNTGESSSRTSSGGSKLKNSDIFSMAKKMEKERDSTLGYKENEQTKF